MPSLQVELQNLINSSFAISCRFLLLLWKWVPGINTTSICCFAIMLFWKQVIKLPWRHFHHFVTIKSFICKIRLQFFQKLSYLFLIWCMIRIDVLKLSKKSQPTSQQQLPFMLEGFLKTTLQQQSYFSSSHQFEFHLYWLNDPFCSGFRHGRGLK